MTVAPSVYVVPILIASSINLNLTCTVELSQLVDVPVTVTTEWTGPERFMISNTAQPVTGSHPNMYTSIAMVSLSRSGREQLGKYTCKATVRAMSSFLTDSVGYSFNE